MLNLEKRIQQLESRFNQMLRVGTVTAVDPAGSARVKIADADGLITKKLKVLVPATQTNKFYHMPDIGEQVLCLFLPIGLETGFILGSFYSDADIAPVSDAAKTHIAFKDGTTIEYDYTAGKLTLNVSGQVDIDVTGGVTIDAETIELNQGAGVVTAECICHFTGSPHGDVSSTVKAGK